MTSTLLNKLNADEILQKLFLTSCFLFVSTVILFDTNLRNIAGTAPFFSAARAIAYLAVIFKCGIDMIQKRFSGKEILFISIMSGFLLFICRNAGSNTVLIFWAFMVAAHNADCRQVIRVCLAAHIFAMILVFGLCFIGVIPDNINIRGNGAQRHSFGFFYGGLLSHFVLYTILMYLYVRNIRLKLTEGAVLLLLSVFIFINTDTKSPFALSVLAIIAACTFNIFPKLQRFGNFYNIISLICGPLSAGGIFLLTWKYNKEIQIFNVLNKILSDRLLLGREALNNYKITLFGQNIPWSVSKGYNYVDSSFLHALFDYGVIFEILLVSVIVLIGLSIVRKKDIWALLCLIIICIHSMFDDQLLWLGSNSFILIAYPYIKANLKECKKKEIIDKIQNFI